jgi:hypothetical protein
MQPVHAARFSATATSRSKPRSMRTVACPSPTSLPLTTPTTVTSAWRPPSSSFNSTRTVVVGLSRPAGVGGRSTGSKTSPPSTRTS